MTLLEYNSSHCIHYHVICNRIQKRSATYLITYVQKYYISYINYKNYWSLQGF